MSITLPPLPDNLISMSHGPFKPSMYDGGENYCVRCHTRSIYLASRQCNPHIDLDFLRARDIEVARLVLKGVAAEIRKWGDESRAAKDEHVALFCQITAASVEKLEVRHHE